MSERLQQNKLDEACVNQNTSDSDYSDHQYSEKEHKTESLTESECTDEYSTYEESDSTSCEIIENIEKDSSDFEACMIMAPTGRGYSSNRREYRETWQGWEQNRPEPRREVEIVRPNGNQPSGTNRQESSGNNKIGTCGDPVSLKTNFFEMIDGIRERKLYMHSIKVLQLEPDVANAEIPIKTIHQILENYFTSAFHDYYFFDSRINIYSTEKLDDDEISRHCQHNEKIFDVTIKFEKEVPYADKASLQAINILMKRVYLTLKMEPLGRSFLDSRAARQEVSERVFAMPAIKSSILNYENNSLLYLLDTHYKFEHKDTVLEVIREMQSIGRGRNQINNELKGIIFRTTYNNRTYKIEEIDFSMTPNNTFDFRQTKISFANYLRQIPRDKIIFENGFPEIITNQPMISVLCRRRGEETATRIYLVPQFCRLTGLPMSMLEQLRCARKAAEISRKKPNERVQALKDFRVRLNTEEIKNEIRKLGLSFGNEMITLTGRNLPCPRVYFDEWTKQVAPEGRYTFGGSIHCYRFLKAPVLNKKIYIVCKQSFTQSSRIRRDIYDFLQDLGMRCDIEIRTLDQGEAEDYRREIERNHRNAELIICIVPNSHYRRYNSIKYQSTIVTPVPTQVIQESTLGRNKSERDARTMLGKILPQMAAKMRGEPWGCKIPERFREGTMYIGIDTYHDAMHQSSSAAAFVASLNSICTRMYSKVSYQTTSLELHEKMEQNVAGACLEWYKNNNKQFPKHLIFYRDGVGDGQLDAVKETEIKKIKVGVKHAINQLYPKGSENTPEIPGITFVVVKKRISARFYLQKDDGYDNPRPGTIIDRKVTKQDWFDFYMISHIPRQGTVNPAHYNVLYDSTGLAPDEIQRLTYQLCWLYYNYTGCISIPAVCGYAHKLAYLSGMSLNGRIAHSSLDDTLFYL